MAQSNLFSIDPPLLEDAGLEDAALSSDAIHEAFRRAAEKMKSATNTLLGNFGTSDGSGCVEDPQAKEPDWEDVLVGKSSETSGTKICAGRPEKGGLIEEGHDAVIDYVGGSEDKISQGEERGPKLGDDSCVDVKGILPETDHSAEESQPNAEVPGYAPFPIA